MFAASVQKYRQRPAQFPTMSLSLSSPSSSEQQQQQQPRKSIAASSPKKNKWRSALGDCGGGGAPLVRARRGRGRGCCGSRGCCGCCGCYRLSSSRQFLVWAAVIWCALCLPGNVVTVFMHHRVTSASAAAETTETPQVETQTDELHKANRSVVKGFSGSNIVFCGVGS